MASTGTSKTRSPKTIQGKVLHHDRSGTAEVYAGIRICLEGYARGQYDKARDIFRKLSEQSSPEVAERARVYMEACGRQATKQGAVQRPGGAVRLRHLAAEYRPLRRGTRAVEEIRQGAEGRLRALRGSQSWKA